MRQDHLREAAIDGFVGSFKLAGELIGSVLKSPMVVVKTFVHHGHEDSRMPTTPPKEQEQKTRRR